MFAHADLCTLMCAGTRVRMGVGMHLRMCVGMCMRMSVRMRMRMHVNMRAYMCVGMRTRMRAERDAELASVSVDADDARQCVAVLEGRLVSTMEQVPLGRSFRPVFRYVFRHCV